MSSTKYIVQINKCNKWESLTETDDYEDALSEIELRYKYDKKYAYRIIANEMREVKIINLLYSDFKNSILCDYCDKEIDYGENIVIYKDKPYCSESCALANVRKNIEYISNKSPIYNNFFKVCDV